MTRLSTLQNGHRQRTSRAAAVDHHAVAVDVVLFTIQDRSLKVLLIKRPAAPFQGAWALPGGLVRRDESVDEAALRSLQEETAITTVYLEQLYTFGDRDRDPRGRVLTVSYYAVVGGQLSEKAEPSPSARWWDLDRLPTLAFDHKKIVGYALERLRNKVNYTSVAFQLLPKTFTLSELQRAYEVILNQALDKRNFRKKMLQLGILADTGTQKSDGRQRPARLYSFTPTRVIKLQEKGIIVPF
jgi:8-oxo-dGTP diphosphatase